MLVDKCEVFVVNFNAAVGGVLVRSTSSNTGFKPHHKLVITVCKTAKYSMQSAKTRLHLNSDSNLHWLWLELKLKFTTSTWVQTKTTTTTLIGNWTETKTKQLTKKPMSITYTSCYDSATYICISANCTSPISLKSYCHMLAKLNPFKSKIKPFKATVSTDH